MHRNSQPQQREEVLHCSAIHQYTAVVVLPPPFATGVLMSPFPVPLCHFCTTLPCLEPGRGILPFPL
ncbi:hypothetical protein SESBI_02644 [Sesbania bispinosa]|nr:hypothetical protein SESBI_02644 [Sesbania bispinosa]